MVEGNNKMQNRRKVLITGAGGYIAGRMLPAFRERYDLVLLDVRNTNRQGEEVPEIHIVDVSDPDRDVYKHYFEGVDAVVHCAFKGGGFEDELNNVQMAYNVYQTSLEMDVRRVVVCSSNHAADYYENLIWEGKWDFVTPEMRPCLITSTDGQRRLMNISVLYLPMEIPEEESFRMYRYGSVLHEKQI